MILERKWLFAFFFVLAFGGVLLSVRLQERTFEAVAVVRILERKSDSGASLLVSQTKGIINPLVMEKAVLKLGLVSGREAVGQIQKKILELQKTVSIRPEGQSGIIQVRVEHVSGAVAVQRVNAIAGAFEEMDLLKAGTEARQYQDFLDRQIQEARLKLSGLEETIKTIEASAAPPEVIAKLESEIAQVNARRQRLLKVFTPKHPEVLKFDEEIAHLESDLAALPQPEGNIESLRREVVEAQNALLSLMDQRQDAVFKQAEETGSVKILRRAVNSQSVKNPIRLPAFLAALFSGAVSGFLALFAAKRFHF